MTNIAKRFITAFLSTPSVRRATEPDSGQKRSTAQFLSTPSVRRATLQAILSGTEIVISIHALREEGDALTLSPAWQTAYFYPRPP